MGARHRARERVLQALYAVQAGALVGVDPESDLPEQYLADLRERFPLDPQEKRTVHIKGDPPEEDRDYGSLLFRGALDNLEKIDRIVSRSASRWRTDRMDAVDLCIIRIAVYELVFVKTVPSAVVINEALELAHRYGNERSPSFVNGVLDHLRRYLDEEGRSKS